VLGGIVNPAVPVKAIKITPVLEVQRMVEPEGKNAVVELGAEKLEVFSGIEFGHLGLVAI